MPRKANKKTQTKLKGKTLLKFVKSWKLQAKKDKSEVLAHILDTQVYPAVLSAFAEEQHQHKTRGTR